MVTKLKISSAERKCTPGVATVRVSFAVYA